MISIILVPIGSQFVDSFLLNVLYLLGLITFFIFLLINFTSKKRWHLELFNISGCLLIIKSIKSIYKDMSYWREYNYKDYYRPSSLYPSLALVFFILFSILLLWLLKRKQKLS